jgi:hypothetical protein
MIRGLSSTGNYTIIAGGAPATPYISNGGLGAGNVRFNTNTQYMEVYDGHSWLQLASSYASVGLTPEAERLLDWARIKMMEELELEALAETNPTIKDLVDQINVKKEQIRVVQTLIKKEETIGTN